MFLNVSRQGKQRQSTVVAWSSGMIPVLGTGGHGFNSRSDPFRTDPQRFARAKKLAPIGFDPTTYEL